MAVCLPDTQDDAPSVPIKLTRVGVTGVKKLLQLKRTNKRPIILVPTFDAFVDLPSDQKGVHMSRNPEAISEVLEDVAKDSTVDVESLCAKIVDKMMTKHEYAERVEISMTTDFMFMKESPVTKNKTQEMAHLKAKAIGLRDKEGNVDIRKSIGAELIGMTVCPCAQESVRESDKTKLLEFLDEETTQKVLDTVTFASHNQRGVGTLLIEVPEDKYVKAEDLIDIIETSMSSPVCELLKRPDENATVMNAHRNPVFVEDCVRNMMEKIVQKYSDFPDDTLITARQENQESIHRHNAYAEQVMGFFDAFKGSRPAIDNERILIVRGRSRKVLPLNEFDSKLTEIGEILGGTELDATSEKISEILEVGDKNIKRSENVTSDVDNKGFMRMQEELESMGLVVEYKVFELPSFDVIIAIWEDKNEIPPLYVEVTVSERED